MLQSENPLVAGLVYRQGTCLDSTLFKMYQAVKLTGNNLYAPCETTDSDAKVAGIVLDDRRPGDSLSVRVCTDFSHAVPFLSDGSGVITAGSGSVGFATLSGTSAGRFAPASAGMLRATESVEAVADAVGLGTLTGGAGSSTGSDTLQSAYNAGSAGPQSITEDATRLGVRFRGYSGQTADVLQISDETPTVNLGITKAGAVSMPATVGTLVQGRQLQGADANHSAFEIYTPTEANTPKFYKWFSQFVNAAGAIKNHVFRRGWNVGGGGAPVDATLPSMTHTIEGSYNPSGTVLVEQHWESANIGGGVTRRPLSAIVNGSTGLAQLLADADDVTIGHTGGPQLLIDSTKVRTYSPNGFCYSNAANALWSAQAGTSATATAKVELEPTAGDVTIQGVRGFVGGISTGVRFRWVATAASMLSPDGNTEWFVANGDIQQIVGGVQTARLAATNSRQRVPMAFEDTTAVTPGSGYSLQSVSGVLKVRNTSATEKNVGLESVGGSITAAATIAPTESIHRLTGGTTIDTVTVPSNGLLRVRFLCDNAVNFSTNGNVNAAVTVVGAKEISLAWDGTSKWWPSAFA